jgi:hypothetical protein
MSFAVAMCCTLEIRHRPSGDAHPFCIYCVVAQTSCAPHGVKLPCIPICVKLFREPRGVTGGKQKFRLGLIHEIPYLHRVVSE